jgi:predicted alpha/beta hydrolase family esterase
MTSKDSDLGGTQDIDRFMSALEEFKAHLTEKRNEQQIIIVGHSLGATTAFNASKYNELPYVSGIIVVAPFSTTNNVINNMFRAKISSLVSLRMLNSKFGKEIKNKIASSHYLPKFESEDAEQAIYSIDQIGITNPHIKYLFVCSMEDKICPPQESKDIYFSQDFINEKYILVLDGYNHETFFTKQIENPYKVVIDTFYENCNPSYTYTSSTTYQSVNLQDFKSTSPDKHLQIWNIKTHNLKKTLSGSSLESEFKDYLTKKKQSDDLMSKKTSHY